VPDIFAALIEDWHHATHPRESQAPAARPVTIEHSTQEEPVSLSADLHALAARVEHFDEKLLADVEAVTAHPETAGVIGMLSALAGINLPPGMIAKALGGVEALLQAFVPPQQPQQPAGQ
jgi:hypothetical protein